MANSTNIWGRISSFGQKHPLLSGLAIMVVVGTLLVWIAMIFLDFWTNHGDNATVPQIKNMQYEQARATLAAEGLKLEISDSIYDTSVPPGTVMESWPKAGAVVKAGREVYVTLTAFSPKMVSISMPVTGVSVRQAVSYLNALGISSIRLVSVPSDYPDLVEGAHSDGRPLGVGSMLPVDATVVLEVGTAPELPEEQDYADSISAEKAIADELSEYSDYSTYSEE